MIFPKAHRVAKPAQPYIPALSTDIAKTIARQHRRLRGKTTTTLVGRLSLGKVVPL